MTNTVTEPITGVVADIIAAAQVPGEDWRLPRTPRAHDFPEPVIPARTTSATWARGDVVVLGRMRWIIRSIRGEVVRLVSSNNTAARVVWTTTLTNLPRRTA